MPPMQKERYIAHVDMDAFFAAIEQRDNPQFRGKPVVIGADPKKGKGRGVVSTCSYEARKFGIHSGMPISIAYRKCPHAIFLSVDMRKYSMASHQIYKILYDFTPHVEPISIDEAFLDITGSFHLFGTPQKTCLLIKSKIKKETRLTASVGLAPVKMVAKIASDLEKPNGFVEVKKDKVLDFLWPLDISKMWGLGKKSEVIFREKGMNTIGDIAKRDIKEMVDIFGKNGAHFWQLANGIDERYVETEVETKSIGNEITFEKDTLDRTKIEGTLMGLCEKVSGRLREEDFKGRTITLKIRLQGFHTFTRAITIKESTNFADSLYKEVKRLYNEFDTKGKKVRLVGVSVSNLLPTNSKDSLFREIADTKRESVYSAIEKINKKFGQSSIHRAASPALLAKCKHLVVFRQKGGTSKMRRRERFYG